MQNYQYYLETIGEYAQVQEVRYPIAIAVGLPQAHLHEIVIAEDGQWGEIFSLDHNTATILLYSQNPIQVGSKFVRTNTFLTVPVGNELLGTVIDPLCRPLFGTNFKRPQKERELETKIKDISLRSRIKKSLSTGVSIVDLMIPLGKGQKELVIGDRKTGKTTLLVSLIHKQAQEGSLIIYAAIARKQSDIKKLAELSQKPELNKNMVVVATNSHDSPSLIYLTPYVAMSMAEYFCEQGNDVVVVLDDLSTHAKFYREISLVAKRFPGRDSYPGDIFHVHARLLEHTGNFKHPQKGEVSISTIPIVETIESDMTGYIATNIMGMTDGHIFFDSNAYYDGRRPAINVSLSVTRVGRQTQSNLKREINRELTAFLSQYEKMQNFSHFGAELSAKIKKTLKTGEALYELFQQHYSQLMPETIQLIMFALIWTASLEELENFNVEALRSQLLKQYQTTRKSELDAVVNVKTMYELLTNINKIKGQLTATATPPKPEEHSTKLNIETIKAKAEAQAQAQSQAKNKKKK